MRALSIAAVALFPLAAGAAPPTQHVPEAEAGSVVPLPFGWKSDSMNLYRTRAGCESIPQQVAGDDREYLGTRLDRLPPGKMLHAVERQVDGCPVVTFVAEERQRQLRTGR
jgi:hypothetical protein